MWALIFTVGCVGGGGGSGEQGPRPSLPEPTPTYDSAPHSRTPTGQPSGTATGGPTGDTSVNAETGDTAGSAHTGDTGTDRPMGPVPYAGAVHGLEPDDSFASKLYAVGDTTGDGRDELYALGLSAYYLIDGLPIGDPDFESSHVGTHMCPGDYGRGGDTNADGFEDVWFRDWLFLGPLTGSWGCSEEDADAWFDLGFGQPNEGAFDINGDGYSETAHFYYGHYFHVHYGPFSGMMPGVDHPEFRLDAISYSPPTGCFDDFSPRGIVLRDYPVAGRLTLVAGDRNYLSCRPSSYFYDVSGGPGGTYSPEDAYAWTDLRYEAKPVGDFNQDGVQDIVFALDIFSGPVSGQLDDLELLFTPSEHDPNIATTIPDMNGDGAYELLVDGPLPQIVLSGRYPIGAPFPAGIPVTLVDHDDEIGIFYNTRVVTGDFDGDGKGDFAFGVPTVNDGRGAVFYWSGVQFSP
ncbi:MAG: hypothetical protein ACI9K2_001281 [Myxococcota bacterium]|jgi:hypothetical protein